MSPDTEPDNGYLNNPARYDVCINILQAIAKLSSILLIDNNLDDGVNRALEILGESINADRLNLHQHCDDSTGETLGYVSVQYEWISEGTESQINHSQLNCISYSGIEDCYSLMVEGKHWGGLVATMSEPFRSGQLKLGVKATYAIPIMVRGKYWGILGLDFCQVAKLLRDTEIEILKTAATCIGSAIEKDHSALFERQKARQLKEHNQILQERDRKIGQSYQLLTATAEAANILLTAETLDRGIDRTLKLIGKILDTDRITVIENWHNPAKPEIPHWKLLYEWDAPQITSQIAHSELAWGSYEGIENLYASHSKGQSTSCKLSEMNEPFRSGQKAIGVKVLHCVPIFIEGKHWGVVVIDDCRREINRSEAELSILKTTAACIGGAIYRQKIQQEKEQAERTVILERERAIKDRAAELDRVNAVLAQSFSKLTEAANLNLFLGEVLIEIARQVNAVGGHIFLYDADNNTLNLFLSVRNGVVYEEIAEHDCELFCSPIPTDLTPVFSRMCQTKEISWLSTSNEVDSTIWWRETIDWHRRMGHQEAAAIALTIGDKPLGFLCLAFSTKPSLKSKELKLLYALTDRAALAIQLANLAKKNQQSALVDERNRMAREIHDTLAQAFTGISLQLEAAMSILSTQPEVARTRLLQAKALAKEGIAEARRSVRALRPESLEFNNLAIALQQLIDNMTNSTDIATKVNIEGELQLTPDLEVDLYRIAQEAITNILRHAQATELSLNLFSQANSLELQIRDNGIGFQPDRAINDSFGLIGMQERCDRHHGILSIDSDRLSGTKITITIPL